MPGNPECWLLFHPKLNHFRQSFSRLDSVVLESVHSVWDKNQRAHPGPWVLRDALLAEVEVRKSDPGSICEWG